MGGQQEGQKANGKEQIRNGFPANFEICPLPFEILLFVYSIQNQKSKIPKC
jgi:hypothetical protein